MKNTRKRRKSDIMLSRGNKKGYRCGVMVAGRQGVIKKGRICPFILIVVSF